MPVVAAGRDVNRRSNSALERAGITLAAFAIVVAPAAQRER